MITRNAHTHDTDRSVLPNAVAKSVNPIESREWEGWGGGGGREGGREGGRNGMKEGEGWDRREGGRERGWGDGGGSISLSLPSSVSIPVFSGLSVNIFYESS